MDKFDYLEIMLDCVNDFQRISKRQGRIFDQMKEGLTPELLDKLQECSMQSVEATKKYVAALEDFHRVSAKLIPLGIKKKKNTKIVPPIRIGKKRDTQ